MSQLPTVQITVENDVLISFDIALGNIVTTDDKIHIDRIGMYELVSSDGDKQTVTVMSKDPFPEPSAAVVESKTYAGCVLVNENGDFFEKFSIVCDNVEHSVSDWNAKVYKDGTAAEEALDILNVISDSKWHIVRIEF